MSPESRSRLWVCEHFRVLPTDSKYKALTDLQANLLFTNYLFTANESDIKAAYWSERVNTKKSLPNREDLVALGYNDKQIDEILKEIAG